MGKSINQVEKNPNWKGGRRKRAKYVYVHVPKHPMADCMGYVAEHRLVAEGSLGRFLHKDEVVHHKNHNPLDNRQENLEVMSRSKHIALHHKIDIECVAAGCVRRALSKSLCGKHYQASRYKPKKN